MPQLLSTNTSVMGRLDEMRKAQISQKVSSEQLNEAKRRTDNLSYAVKAEIQYFDDERVKDTTSLIANFLKLQIASHQKAVASLQGALQSMVDIYGHDVGDDLARGSEHAFHAGINLRK